MENSEIKVEEIDAVEQEFTTNSQTSENPSNEEQTKNIIVTPAQQDILKEITKIDIELEALEKTTVNEDEFYDKLDDILTPEEKYLQEDNPKEYLKVIDAKKKEYIQNNTNEAQKNALLEQKKDLELKNAIEIGVMEVTAIYKDYNHTEMQTFWNKKLNKEEQDEILTNAKSTAEVFKKTHEKFLEKSGKKVEIKNTPPPNTIDMSKVQKQPIKANQISEIDSEEEKYKKALGV